MPLPTVLKTNRVIGIVSALILLVWGVAIADIVSGLSTTNSSTNVTITNLSLVRPADVVTGDVMLASVAIHDGNAVTVTPPAGWTQILRTDNETNVSIATYWKVSGVSEPSNYVWTLSPQTRAQGGITRYTGVDTSNPIDVVAGNSGRGTVATTSSVTTTTSNAMVVAIYALHVGGLNHAGDFFSAPVGMTQRYDVSYTTAGPTIAEFDGVQAVAGSTGMKTSDISGNRQRDWVSQIITLRPEIPSTLSNGLIHYWKLDEANGNAADSVGSMTLNNVNGTQFVTAKLNNGANLERDIANEFRSTVDVVSSPLTSYSVCSWFKPESAPADGLAHHIWSSYDVPGNMDLTYVNFGPGGGNIKALWFRHFNSGDDGNVQLNGELDTSSFYHACGTWDGTTVSLYVNGSLVGTNISNGIDQSLDNQGTAIGNDAGGSPFDGVIDEVGFWTRALSASEISELYNAGQGVSYPF